MAQTTLRPSMLLSSSTRSSPASCYGRCQMASMRISTLTTRQPIHNGSRRAAKTLAYRGGRCDGQGPAWRGAPFQMNINPNDVRVAGDAFAQMMDMARKWQASNPSTSPKGGSSNPYPSMQLPLAVDLEEGEASYTLTADVPGLQKSDLKITVNQKDRTLTIKGERVRASKATAEPVNGEGEKKEEPAQQQQYWQRFERLMGKFQRTLSWVPDDADLSAVSARVEKGVLQITVQKMEKQQNDDIVDINIE